VNETTTIDPKAVFINAPFDHVYEPLFITLVGLLTFLDYKAHCVLEIRETGEGRLQRIYELMRRSRISLHDMSRIGTPARFNMPFELGLACSLKLADPTAYEIIVFDSKPYRMDRRLSDYKGRDFYIHHGTQTGIIAAILDAFQSPGFGVAPLRHALRDVRTWAEQMKRDLYLETIFHPHLFSTLVQTAAKAAATHGLLAP
jgi:hypothetical protein